MTAAVADIAAVERSERPTLLFVDDEAGVLDGIRLALRPVRKEFRFLWAGGAQEALDLLQAHDVDVVVSDMRMPGMTGADLLETVRRDHPGVVRYILSGEAAPDLVMRAMLTAHRWLAKPCPREVLVEAIHDATRYRRLTHNSTISEVVGGVTSLPSLPEKYCQLQALLADPETSLDAVAALVETDPATSAKLLQLANSAFAAGVESATVRDAVGRIGLVAVSQLVLSAEVTRALDPGHVVAGIRATALDAYGNEISRVAKGLAAPPGRPIAAIGGLLSQIGILLQASAAPQRLERSCEHAVEAGVELHIAERALHGATHTDLAAYLLSIWGLPTELVLAVLGSTDLPDPQLVPPFNPSMALCAARVIVSSRSDSELGLPPGEPLDDELSAAIDRWTAFLDCENT